MIGTMNVVGISHLTHNQVVTGSSPAGPGSQDCKTCKKDRKGISQFFIYIEQ